MSLRRHLTDCKKCRLIDRIKGGQHTCEAVNLYFSEVGSHSLQNLSTSL